MFGKASIQVVSNPSGGEINKQGGYWQSLGNAQSYRFIPPRSNFKINSVFPGYVDITPLISERRTKLLALCSLKFCIVHYAGVDVYFQDNHKTKQ